MDFEPTVQKANQIVCWLKDEFTVAANRCRPSYAKLLRILPSSLHIPETISLDEFSARIDPTGGFYTENEMLELFKTEFGIDRKVKRNSSLRQRIVKAVRELAPHIAAEPAHGDLLRYWLDDDVTERFANATPTPVLTFQDLLDLMDHRGKTWHRAVPKIGPSKAARIASWMSRNGLLQETSIVAAGGAPAEKSSGFVPMERFAPPPELTGEGGTNRAYSNKLAAHNDMEAIEAWLASHGNREHTVRSYRTHVERFLLWMIKENGKALSSATIEDCTNYRDFLGDLRSCKDHNEFINMIEHLVENNKKWTWRWQVPLDQWVGRRSAPRRSKIWRPFNGRLSESSQNLSITILSAMCEWLTRQKYLESNPFDGVAPVDVESRIKTEHALTKDQWTLVIKACEDLPKNEAYYRIRFTLFFAYGTGQRLAELVSAKVANPNEKLGEPNYGLKPSVDGSGWDIDILGKGKRKRLVPISCKVMEALQDYMEVRGQGRDPTQWKHGTALIATLNTEFPFKCEGGLFLSHSTFYRMLDAHFKLAADQADNAQDAGRLASASGHWLRHTFATHAANNGADLDALQELMGHSSPSTTSIYRNANRERKLAAVENLSRQAVPHSI
jgi:site-specific recombinase XerD